MLAESRVLVVCASDRLKVLHLPHPRTGSPASFGWTVGIAYEDDGASLLEIQQVPAVGTKSWFIDNAVKSDGTVTIMSPVDPLFVLLPLLDRQRCKTDDSLGRYLTVEDILHSDSVPDLMTLSESSALPEQLKLICDHQPAGAETVYRLSDERTLRWLRYKTSQLVDTYDAFPCLQTLNKLVSMSDELSEADNIRARETRIRVAIDIVSDYLPDAWADILLRSYQLRPPVTPILCAVLTWAYVLGSFTQTSESLQDIIRRELQGHGSTSKRPTSCDLGQQQGASAAAAKRVKPSVGVQKLAKASKSGMQSLTSFFKKV
ncbi:hypothetical protein RI367_006417 [Sorochytrium milnesiophthora]